MSSLALSFPMHLTSEDDIAHLLRNMRSNDENDGLDLISIARSTFEGMCVTAPVQAHALFLRHESSPATTFAQMGEYYGTTSDAARKRYWKGHRIFKYRFARRVREERQLRTAGLLEQSGKLTEALALL